ncbi:MAG: Mov34/MPN/PAD-1 family protein [Candidatus Eremiobacteraeota bacterium]|nr:Mov34/MPN/PAD-1 family protein [Candidatus Eremiobacteraeota bacterium]
MLQWKNVESDLIINDISALLAGMDWLQAVRILGSSFDEPLIFTTERCHETIVAHLESDKRNELGGLLIGTLYKYPYRVRHNYPYLSIITDSVESLDFRNSSVSLRMGTELWNRAQSHLEKGKIIIGWYHSHPNLGAFFSGTDRATQRAFFNHPYSLGVVIDPVRFEVRSFIGPHCESLEKEGRVIDDSLACLI